VVGLTTGSRGNVRGKTCEKRIRNNNSIQLFIYVLDNSQIWPITAKRNNNNNNNNNNNARKAFNRFSTKKKQLH
jgi:hypothetical protein